VKSSGFNLFVGDKWDSKGNRGRARSMSGANIDKWTLTSRIDTTAHKGAQRLFVAGLSVGAIYWGAVIRWSESWSPFFQYDMGGTDGVAFFTDAGWDVMEPVSSSCFFHLNLPDHHSPCPCPSRSGLVQMQA